jgi:CheY-like chemotaxis protein
VSDRRLVIVLIEPLPADVRWFEIIFADAGISCELVCFSSAVQALSTLRSTEDAQPDLIIMSFGLPFLTPTEAISRLRELPHLTTVPIAVAVEHDFEISMVEGATHFLVKPADTEQLQRILGPEHVTGGFDATLTAKAWKRIVEEITQSGPTDCLILESWERCRDAGIGRNGETRFRQIAPDDLGRRLGRNADLIDAARDRLTELSNSLRNTKHVVYLTDADGIVLYSAGTDALMRSLGLRPGFDWSERTMGTNGAGTALACNRPIAVIGTDHWHSAFRDAACFGAPIRDSCGVPVGAVDLSTHVEDCRRDQLADIIRVALRIEADLQTELTASRVS